MCPDNQVKACIHTAREYFKADFSGSCIYIASEIACIFPEKDPGYQRYRTSGRDTPNKRAKKEVLLQLHQAYVSIRKAGRRTELTYMITHGIIIYMNGTSYLAQRIPS